MIKVDLALFSHVHNYERTCAVYQEEYKAMPTADENRINTYDNSNYSAPVQAVVIGMAGFTLNNFTTDHVSKSQFFPYLSLFVISELLNSMSLFLNR
jgi:hypothetical protein